MAHPYASVGERMSYIPHTADLDAKIESLIREAESSLRQQHDEMRRDNDTESCEAQALRRHPPDPRERLSWWRWFFKQHRHPT